MTTMTRCSIPTALIWTMALGACASTAETQNVAGGRMETRVYVAPSCPKVTGKETLSASLAGIFLPKLIENSIIGLGNALKKAGEDQVTSKTAMTTGNFYSVALGKTPEEESKLNLNIGCISIAYGKLAQLNEISHGDDFAKEFGSRFDAENRSKLANYTNLKYFLSPHPDIETIEFTDDVRFFAQYEISRSPDQTALVLTPKIVFFGDQFSKPRWSANGNRDVVLVVSFRLPGNTIDKSFAVLTSKFPNARVHSVLAGTELSSHSTEWMSLPPIPAAVTSRLSAYSKRLSDLQALNDLCESIKSELTKSGLKKEKRKELELKLDDIEDRISKMLELTKTESESSILTTPVTISATLTETQDGNKYLVALGSYLSENSKDISNPIFASIDPEAKKKAKAAKLDAEDELRIAAIEAVNAYEEENAKTGTDRDDSKVRVGKIKAKQACRKLEAAGYEDIGCVGF